MLEEKEEERNPNYGVDYCHQLEIDYYHHFLSLLSRSGLQNLSPLSLWSLVSVSDRGNKDDRVEERTWQKNVRLTHNSTPDVRRGRGCVIKVDWGMLRELRV